MTKVSALAPRPLVKRAITIEFGHVPAYEDIEGVLERRAFQTDRLRNCIHEATLSRASDQQ